MGTYNLEKQTYEQTGFVGTFQSLYIDILCRILGKINRVQHFLLRMSCK